MKYSPNSERHLFAWLRNRILGGLVIVIPISLTFWFGYFLVTTLSDWAVNYIRNTYPLFILKENGKYIVPALWTVRALSILILLIFLCAIGQLGRYTIGKKLISITDYLMRQLPMLNTVYNTARQIWEAIWSTREGVSSRVVMFEYPRKGIWVIGFLTNENNNPDWEPQQRVQEDLISVFLPTTPNPTSGFFLLIPREDLVILDMDSTEAMQMIVSGGTVTGMHDDKRRP
jgi:uncharacterized membrane protein